MQEVYFRGREKSKFRTGLNLKEEAEEFPFYSDQRKRKLSVHLGSIWQLPYCQPRRAQGNPHVEVISPSSPFPWHLVSNMFVHLIADICKVHSGNLFAKLCKPEQHSEISFSTDVCVNSLLRNLSSLAYKH